MCPFSVDGNFIFDFNFRIQSTFSVHVLPRFGGIVPWSVYVFPYVPDPLSGRPVRSGKSAPPVHYGFHSVRSVSPSCLVGSGFSRGADAATRGRQSWSVARAGGAPLRLEGSFALSRSGRVRRLYAAALLSGSWFRRYRACALSTGFPWCLRLCRSLAE